MSSSVRSGCRHPPRHSAGVGLVLAVSPVPARMLCGTGGGHARGSTEGKSTTLCSTASSCDPRHAAGPPQALTSRCIRIRPGQCGAMRGPPALTPSPQPARLGGERVPAAANAAHRPAAAALGVFTGTALASDSNLPALPLGPAGEALARLLSSGITGPHEFSST